MVWHVSQVSYCLLRLLPSSLLLRERNADTDYFVQSFRIPDQVPSDLQTPLPLPDFLPMANRLQLIAITNKTPLRNVNCPIADTITKTGVAHTLGPNFIL